MLCYEFLVGDSPFEADDDEELFNQILTAKVQYPAKLNPAAREFVDQLLDRNPNTRLGCGPKGKETVCSPPNCTSTNMLPLLTGLLLAGDETPLLCTN